MRRNAFQLLRPTRATWTGVYYLEGDNKNAGIGLVAAGVGIVADAGLVKTGVLAAETGYNTLKVAKVTQEAATDVVQVGGSAQKAVHANSRLSEKEQHLYEIYRKNADGTETVVKTGISSGKTTADGENSYRATRQINQWVTEGKAAKGELQQRIVGRVSAGTGARERALGLEKANADRLRNLNPENLRDLDFHVRP